MNELDKIAKIDSAQDSFESTDAKRVEDEEGGSEQEDKRRLVYSEKFKSLINTHPKAIQNFLDFERYIKDHILEEDLKYGDEFNYDDLRITIVSSSGKDLDGSRLRASIYFKVDIGGESFFVKNKPGFLFKGRGFDELESLKKISEIIKDLPFAKVVDFQLGYQGKEEGSYFVSKWIDGIPFDLYFLREFGRSPYEKRDLINFYEPEDEKRDELEGKYRQIVDKLEGYGFVDVRAQNMIYLPQDETFYLFDIHDYK